MPDNLLDLQSSFKPLRNPFKFDFTYQWDGQKRILPGNGQWKNFIGPLADHIVRHLTMKISYAYHDREVAKLKEVGKEKLARAYSLPADIRNKIHMAITGQPHPNYSRGVAEEISNDDIDFSELSKTMQDLQRAADTAVGEVSVAPLLEQAAKEAEQSLGDIGSDHHSHHKGSANVFDGPVNPTAGALPMDPVAEPPVEVAPPAPPSPAVTPEAPAAPAASSEFAGMKELD